MTPSGHEHRPPQLTARARRTSVAGTVRPALRVSPSSGSRRPRLALAGITAAGLIALLMLLLAAAPVYTDDVWWHLASGEHYLRHGLWPSVDPLLHTGLESGPVQHEWLFGVLMQLTHQTFGFHGLRLLHGALVVVIVWSLWRVLVARGLDAASWSLIVAAFVVLAWFRLYQLRPDLVSILATVALYGLVLRPCQHAISRRDGLMAIAIFLPWANMHSLFLVGINLIVAALLGLAMHAVIAATLPSCTERRLELRRCVEQGRILALVLVAGLLVAAINPRGFAHHLTFLTSSAQTAIWHVTDEWSHFVPFDFSANDKTVSLLRWAVMNVAIVAFALAATVRAGRLWRQRTAGALRDFDCVGFGLGLAAIVAIIVSIRFLWMGFLPLAYALALASRGGDEQARWRVWALPVASVALLVGFAGNYGFQNLLSRYGPAPSSYLSHGYASHKYHAEGVHFLRESGVEGRLFNDYELGGFIGYWLAPALRTFVDGRAEHYGFDVYSDYSSVMRMRFAIDDEDFTEVLDRRGVDVFFGVGFPGWWRDRNTTEYLRGVKGWHLVSRSYRHAIYLRDHPRNAVNMERIARYYANEGVPFDRQRGLDPAQVMRERPDWAEAHGMLPRGFDRLGDDDRAIVYALNGAYEEQVALDRARAAADPRAEAPRRRMVYALLRLDRAAEALVVARELYEVAGKDAESSRLLRLVKRYRAMRGEAGISPRKQTRLNRLLRHASPINAGDTWPIEYLMRTEGYPLRRAPRP